MNGIQLSTRFIFRDLSRPTINADLLTSSRFLYRAAVHRFLRFEQAYLAIQCRVVDNVLHAQGIAFSLVTAGKEHRRHQIGTAREHGTILLLLLAVGGGGDKTDLIPSLRNHGPRKSNRRGI